MSQSGAHIQADSGWLPPQILCHCYTWSSCRHDVDWRVHSCVGVFLSLPVACIWPPRSMDFSKQWWRLCLGTTLTSFMFNEICGYSLQKQGFTIILWKATNSFSNGLSYMRSIEFKLGYVNLAYVLQR